MVAIVFAAVVEKSVVAVTLCADGVVMEAAAVVDAELVRSTICQSIMSNEAGG